MPDLTITDSLGNPIDISTVQWNSASSLFRYGKAELLHLAVLPDFMSLKDKGLSEAAAKPIRFRLALQHDFPLGSTTPEVDLTPSATVMLFANAAAGSDLFDDDGFHVPVTVPAQTAFAGLSFQGALDLGVFGSSGDLTFGVDRNQSLTLQFVKAFPTGTDESTLGNAAAAVLASFVIPATVEDLKRLNAHDVCCVSGAGTLTLSGSVNVLAQVNPLASVNLPLGAGTLAVQDGVLAGVSATVTLSGSYQIRVERLADGGLRLSYLRDRGATFTTDLSASAGVSVDLNTTDLLPKLLGGITGNKVDPKILDGLSSDDTATFTSMLKAGVNHSLQVSLDLALSKSVDRQTAFQYHIQPELLDEASTAALNRALKGDLSLLTTLEEGKASDGTIAPGIKLLNSVFATAKSSGFTMKVNLLGIVNLISASNLMSNCEFLFEPASGDLTIKETAESDRISAITDPYKRQAALRKAMFDSVIATTTYVASKVVTLPNLSCETVHFATTQNSNRQTIADYTNWMVALHLMQPEERAAILSTAGANGLSTCVIRAPLDQTGCEALFFDGSGTLRAKQEYLEIGRTALKALLDPTNNAIDGLRYRFLNNDATWQKALAIGPSPQLSTLIPLASTDSQFNVALNDVIGDLYDIVWWADSMQKAGSALQDMRTFLASHDPSTLADDPDFTHRRDGLQKLMVGVVSKSQVRFSEPWGLVCLYWAAGSRRSSGKITSQALSFDRESGGEKTVTAGKA